MWKGFSKSAGALGVRKKTVPSSASTRASSRTWPSGSSKCSMRWEEQAQPKLPRAKPRDEGVHLGHLQAVTAPPARGRRHRVGAVVGPDHRPVLGQEAGRLEPLAAADVEHGPGAQPLDDRPVAGGVEGQQRIGGHPLHGPLAGEPPGRPSAGGPRSTTARPPGSVPFSLMWAPEVVAGPWRARAGSESFAGRRLFTLPITRVGSPTFHRRAPRPVPGPVGLYRRLRSPSRLRAVVDYSALAVLALVPMLASQPRTGDRRHQDLPLPRSGPLRPGGRLGVGPGRGSRDGDPPEHRLPAARWGRSSGPWPSSTCRCGSPSGCGWAACSSPPAPAPSTCAGPSGSPARAATWPPSASCSPPTCSSTRDASR